MLNAGISIDSIFESILKPATDSDQKFKFEQIIKQIKKGDALSTSFKKNQIVPVFDIPLIESGEKSGNLTNVFQILSKNYQQAADSEKIIKAGLLTPFITFAAALFLPSFPDLFVGKITLANYLIKNLGLLAIILLLAYLAYQYFMQSYYDLHKARLKHNLLSYLPYFDQLSRKISLEKFCFSLSMMLEAGMPLFEALQLAGKTSPDEQLEQASNRIVKELKNGKPLAKSFGHEKIFSADIVNSISLGAESGKLPHFLNRSGQQLKSQITQSIDRVSKAIPKVVYWLVVIYVAWTIIQFYTARVNLLNTIVEGSLIKSITTF